VFTGLVEAVGTLRSRSGAPVARCRFEVAERWTFELGESIAVDGCCLTVARFADGWFEADLSPETLSRTTLGELGPGSPVHLERSTPAGGRLGGHVVLGHVDGVGTVVSAADVGATKNVTFRAPRALAPYLAEKGSVAVEGVSLTVNAVRDEADGCLFDVTLVPHTLDKTHFGRLRPGTRVNLEADVLARYVARQLSLASGGSVSDADARLLAKLREGGF